MPLMNWNDSFSVGIAAVDSDHKKLVEMVNNLFDGVREGKGTDAVGAVLDDLIAYTVEHFNREEKMFASCGYPDAASHKQQHEDLKQQVLAIQGKFHDGTSKTLTLDTMNFLKDWLTNHIRGSDQKYGPFLTSHGIH